MEYRGSQEMLPLLPVAEAKCVVEVGHTTAEVVGCCVLEKLRSEAATKPG